MYANQIWTEESLKEVADIAYYKWLNNGQPQDSGDRFWDAAQHDWLTNRGLVSPSDEILEVNYRNPKPIWNISLYNNQLLNEIVELDIFHDPYYDNVN